MSDPSETVTDLASALTSLEAALDPLLASTYEEVSNPTLDPLQKAKLDVIVGYVVHDLIWSEHPAEDQVRRS
jgi:exosome complex protein LRP1